MSLGELDLSLKPQKLELFLAKPNKTIIAKLKEAGSLVNTVKLGNVNELSFTVPFEVEISNQLRRNPNVDRLKDRYLIKAQMGDKSDWYIINNIQDSMDDDGDSRAVTAMLLPYEMTNKMIKTFQYESLNLSTVLKGGTTLDVETSQPVAVEGILTNTRWKLGYVDASFEVRFRAFDFSSVTVLDAIFQVAETFNALAIWNTDTRTVSFYDPELFGIDRGLIINYGHYLKSLSKESKGDEIITRLKVFGKDGLSIQRLNITGQNYLEDYSYFMYPFQRYKDTLGVYHVTQHSDYMSDELCSAILDFGEFIEMKQGQFDTLLTQKKNAEHDLFMKEEERNKLIGELAILKNELDTANYFKTDASEIIAKKDQKEEEISRKKDQITVAYSVVEDVNKSIATLRSDIAYNNFFNDALREELTDYVLEQEWVNENIDIDTDLYEESKKEFEKVKMPQVVINIDMVNFLEIVESQRDWDKLNLGDIITIRYDKLDINMTAKLIEYSINHEDGSISVTIANTKDILSDEEKFIKMLYSSTAASTTLNTNKFKWDGIGSTASQVDKLINDIWDANKRNIEAGQNNSIEISPRGIIIRDKTDPMSYLVAQNGLIAITNDNGNSWKHAMTKDGIIGERIFGKLIAGVNLMIDASDSSGTKTFTVDGNGVTIAGAKLTITGGLPPNQLDPTFKDSLVNLTKSYNGVVIDSVNGLVITKSNNLIRTILNATEGFSFEKNVNGTWTKMLFYDASTGNMKVDGEINAKALKVNGVNVLTVDNKISTSGIETLEVGKNVIMGPNAYISWANIANQPFIPTDATQIGGISSTYIDANGIWTGKINANSIVAGTISADRITGGSITSSTINVSTDATVGNRLYIGQYNDRTSAKGIYLNSVNSITVGGSSNNRMIIAAQQIQFSAQTIDGLPAAKFG